MDSVQCNLQPSSSIQSMNVGDVHVWRACLDQITPYLNTLFRTLSPDEQQKVGNYRFDNDRNRFVAARGMLRKILGEYLNCCPGQIRFSYNRYGKPFLNHRDNPLRFNVTHSRGFALFAVACGRDIGIDVEFIDPGFDVVKTAQRIFSPADVSRLLALDSDLRATAFFRGWTRNEAFLKAVGTGFSYSEKSFYDRWTRSGSDISFGVTGRKKGRDWTLIDLSVDENYKAALVIQGEPETIRYHQCVTE